MLKNQISVLLYNFLTLNNYIYGLIPYLPLNKLNSVYVSFKCCLLFAVDDTEPSALDTYILKPMTGITSILTDFLKQRPLLAEMYNFMVGFFLHGDYNKHSNFTAWKGRPWNPGSHRHILFCSHTKSRPVHQRVNTAQNPFFGVINFYLILFSIQLYKTVCVILSTDEQQLSIYLKTGNIID